MILKDIRILCLCLYGKYIYAFLRVDFDPFILGFRDLELGRLLDVGCTETKSSNLSYNSSEIVSYV